MTGTMTLAAIVLIIMWISGSSSITLPGLDVSTSIDDPAPFHLPPYLNPVNKGIDGTTTQPTTRSPPAQPPASHSNTAGQNGNKFSNYLIQTLTHMDANSLKTLSQIINLELNKQSPSGQIQGQTQSQTDTQGLIQGQIPLKTNIGQRPHIVDGSFTGTSDSQHQHATITGSPKIQQEGQGHSQYNNLSKKPPSTGFNSGQTLISPQQQSIGSSTNQQSQTVSSLGKTQLNPGYMSASGIADTNGHRDQNSPNTMFHNAEVGSRPLASEVETSFDPNKLMASIEAETSQYNPNAFLTKQIYITANQWNANQNQVPQQTQQTSPVQTDETDVQENNKPSIMGTSQLNFKPDSMMAALGMKGHVFTFDPDKINSYGSSGFQPGMYPPSFGNKEIPKNMFNADTVNKDLMTYSGQSKQQLNQEEKVVHHSAYNPDIFNHPAVKTVPSTYLQFMGNEGRVTVNPYDKPLAKPVPTPSQARLRQQFRNNFHQDSRYANNVQQTHAQPLSPISGKDNTFSITRTYQAAFNPDRINAAQRQFDPDSLIKSLFIGEDSQALPDPFETKFLRKSSRNENGTEVVEANISRPHTPSPKSKDSQQSTTLSSTITPTDQPETTIGSTVSVNPPRVEGPLFNPDNVNAGIAQMMNFSPGSLMMGYNQVPAAAQTNTFLKAEYNPNQVNQMGKFQSGLSPMMSALTGGIGGTGNTGSQAGSQPSYDMSGSMTAMFNPAEVNKAKMSFDIYKQMGFNENSGNAMFDPMKVNVLATQKSNQSTEATNENNGGFLSTGGMSMMDNSAFTGNFDPNQVNQVSITAMQDNKQQNNSSNTSNMDYMSAFLGMGSLGSTGGSAFGGSFNPSEVNTAAFNPNDVNNVKMNFDPSNMLDRNPGYDLDKATQTNFDPTKINDVHMNFEPPFIPVDKNKNDNSTTTSSFSQYNSEFTPGQLFPNGKAMVFNPTSVNQAKMHFSAVDMLNSKGVDGSNTLQDNTLFSPQLPNKNSNIGMPVFDPVAVNNMQLNFVPNSGMSIYQSSSIDTSSGQEHKPSTASMSSLTTPSTITSQTTLTTTPSPSSSPNPTEENHIKH
ncbi:uncharacterized protein LOC110442573 [Mizuhopecten yessoensis]|uniref:uncharacterized protein LOC110442573 n=1 Tax=Mizuhopecten yessoensis TaxID=6573 RepID=UPI000B45F4E3|nr:uncharacterized protein LOC110442573 [Mizuhopecten yessoensis]